MAFKTTPQTHGATMKTFFEFVFVCMIVLVSWLIREQITDHEEIASLRTQLYGANIARNEIQRRASYPPKHIGNYHAIYAASEETGCPIRLLSAVSRQENGPFGYELGNTKLPSVAYQKHYPPEFWNYIAGGHTIMVYMGKWIWDNKKNRKEFLTYLAKKYHPKGHKQWYKNVNQMVESKNG